QSLKHLGAPARVAIATSAIVSSAKSTAETKPTSALMTSKENILNSIRRNRPAPNELPDLNRAWTTYSDPRAKFVEVLEAVGGKAIIASDRIDLNEQVQRLPYYSSAKQVVSFVSGVGSPNVDLAAVDSPHD